jgi:hypothetical protein
MNSGIMPKIKAREVIMIGRSRSWAASMAASRIEKSVAPSKSGEFDDQNRVLSSKADQRYKSNLKIDVVVQSAHPNPKDRTKHSKRESTNDCQR